MKSVRCIAVAVLVAGCVALAETSGIKIPVNMPYDGKLTVAIDDKDGNRVRSLVNAISYDKGHHEIAWDGYTEDRLLIEPGEYSVRIAVSPGLSYRYLGYSMDGGEQDAFIPRGPNHMCLRAGCAHDGKVAFGALFTEGGYSTIVLDAKTGKFERGWHEHWHCAKDSLQLVSGDDDWFYGIRTNIAKGVNQVFAYNWYSNEMHEVKYENLVEKLGGKIPTIREGWLSSATLGEETFAIEEGKHAIQVYDAKTGKLKRTMGEEGGFYFGKWRKNRLVNPNSITLDTYGYLWVTENRFSPKRITKWDPKTGECVYEKFGPSAYGYPGAGFDQEDHSVWMAYDTLWHFDEKTNTDHPVAMVLPGDSGRSRFAGGGGYSEDEGATADNPIPANFMHYTFFHEGGKTYVRGQGKAVTTFLLENDRFKPVFFHASPHMYLVSVGRHREGNIPTALRAAYAKAHPEVKDADLDKTIRNDRTLLTWRDHNGDGLLDADEFSFVPVRFSGGYWGYWAESLRYSVPVENENGRNFIIDFGFPFCDAETAYADKKPITGKIPAGEKPASGESCALTDSHGNPVIIAGDRYMLGFTSDGKLKWKMYNPSSGVHGSHKAGLPVPGELQSILFNLGCVPYSKTADVFAAQNNHGIVYFITSDGLFLGELFNDCRVAAKYDEHLIGGEPFGGVFGYDRKTKRAIMQAGGCYRRYEILGLDKVKELRQKLKVTPAQLEECAKTPMKIREGEESLENKVSWKLGQNIYWRGVQGNITMGAHWEGDKIRFDWLVPDSSPWVNNGEDPAMKFKTGDCIDMQYLDKDGKPCRLMFYPPDGVVLYRHDAKGNAKSFSSPWRTHTVGDVSWPEDIKCGRGDFNGGYSFYAIIPSQYLKGVSKADFGVIYGDEEGKVNLSRVYWSNKETGLVNDVPGEIIPQPSKWGKIDLGGAAAVKKAPETAKLVDCGILGNSGDVILSPDGDRANRFDYQQTSPAYDPKKNLIYMSAGRGRINAYSPAGKLEKSFILPNAHEFGAHDTITLGDDGELFVLAGGGRCIMSGWQRQESAGNLYRIETDGEIKIVAKKVHTIAQSVKDGKLVLFRANPRNSETKGGVFYSLDTKTLEETRIADFVNDDVSLYTNMLDYNPDGKLAAVIRAKRLFYFDSAFKLEESVEILDGRQNGMNYGSFLDGYLWSVQSDTIKRLDGRTGLASPGVVMGGASGYFIGRVDCNHELDDSTGIRAIGNGEYIIGTANNAAVYICRFDEATKRLKPVRRIGAIKNPSCLALDSDGNILADNLVWPWNASKTAIPSMSHRRLPVRAAVVLPGDVAVMVQDAHSGKVEVRSFTLGDEFKNKPEEFDRLESDGPLRGKSGERLWTTKPVYTRVKKADDEKNCYDIESVMEDGLVRVYRVRDNGHAWAKKNYFDYREEAPDPDVREAVDGELVAVTDAKAGTLSLFAVGADGSRRLLDTVCGLVVPRDVAINNGRIIVFESSSFRLHRFSVDDK